MKQFFKYIFTGFAVVCFLSIFTRSEARGWAPGDGYGFQEEPSDADTGSGDTIPYPFDDQSGQDPLYFDNNGNLKLNDPSNIKTTVTYDPDSNIYIINQNVGGLQYRPPTYVTLDEYIQYDLNKSVHDYWKSRSHAESQNQAGSRGLIPPIKINSQAFDRIFGGGTIDIRPQGSAELIFGVNINRTENPALPERQRRISTFDFDEKIQLNVVGKIGDKLKLTTNYNTEATFDFENQMKLEYTGYEDEIIKKIEAGNVNLPLNGSLITGSQSLFGVKTQLQFGKMTVTSVISQEKGKKSEVNVQGGAQTNTFEVEGANYESNKHFFLSQYFYNNYDQSLANFPVVNSAVNITRMEVWVTNRNGSVDNTRNIVAFTDLGESTLENVGTGFINVDQPGSPPENDTNSLYQDITTTYAGIRDINNVQSVLSPLAASNNFTLGTNYEKISNARRLSPTEYTFNPRLGFISLNQSLNYDEVLAVAYQYTMGNKVYQVGEFSDGGISGQDALFLKLLKGTNLVPKITDPSTGLYAEYRLWDLMMKNIYSIGAYQVNPQDFRLDVWYNNQATGTDVNYVPTGPNKGKLLLQVMNLDKLNYQSQASPDGVFDFLEGVTIMAANGRIIFPQKEPLGNNYFTSPNGFNADPLYSSFVYQELYDSTKTAAQQIQSKNRFKLKGQYKSSSSSEISLNAVNIPQGSVTVTAGGAPLTENQDYTVDYALGRVKIINEGILNSGVPIKISLESNSLFSIQSKTLFGTHFDYRVNKDFNVGATMMNLTERPLTQKVNIGEEPMSNWIFGMDVNYRTEAPFLTRLIDKLPLLSTKEMSTISALGEVAYLLPGVNKAIGKTGTSYLDDFEGTQSLIDIRSPQGWSLASIPQGQPSLFPEASLHDTIATGYNRALLSWYTVDPLFTRHGSNANNLKPDHIDDGQQSDHNVREILETEVFPNKQPPQGQPLNIPSLDMTYYPSLRGPYNFDVNPGIYSAGLSANGTLNNPASRWGGIMRKIETNDFEAANIEFIQFWLMDPFNEDNPNPNTSGELIINIGNISEDVMKDGRNSFENGLPTVTPPTLIDTTAWGRVPILQSVVNAFDNDEAKRVLQDVGLDGLNNDDERTFFAAYLTNISSLYGTGSPAFQNAQADPAGDGYSYYRGPNHDAANDSILERYRYFNGMEGNSNSTEQTDGKGNFTPQSTTLPNQEDVNRDNTLSETESYYQYRIKLTPNDVNPANIGNNFISDVLQTTVVTADGRTRPITWYQFKVPVRSFNQKIGNIDNFNSIRFIRMFFNDVDKQITCRFARLELVRSDWRKYLFSLINPGEYLGNDQSGTEFNVSAVNIEENGNRIPVNYVLPPGIDREQNVQSANLVRLNEQSLSMRVCGLEDGDARAAYKNSNLDVRSYKKLRMFIHAEAAPGSTEVLNDNDISVFVRLGTDLTDNYYEYEIPVKITPPGNYGANDDAERKKVWPEANNLELAFTTLQAAKQRRNIDLAGGLIALTSEYVTYDPDNTERIVRVKGNPNLSNVRVMMVGIRNPKKIPGSSDDGLAKCAEVWVNELRLTDFDDQGGWAATARVTAKLADFGTLNLSGNMATPGFGSIEKKVSERLRENQMSYDVSTQLEMGKFFPEKWNLRIPLFWGYGESKITPQYNPLDPDILLKPVLSDENLDAHLRDSIADVTVDITRRRSFNLTNVRKERGKGSKKVHPWDIENFSASYAFTEISRHNVNLEISDAVNTRGGLTYICNMQPKNIKPFEKVKALNKKSLAIIRDINFTPAPSMLGFSTDLNRTYGEQKNRNITTDNDVIIQPFFNKNFVWTRNYDLRWDLTKNLKLEFSADNDSRILEPEGRIDTKEEKQEILDSLKHLGTNMNYHHNSSINYNLPINKLPLMDWTTSSVRYTTTYSWMRAPLAADSVGNTISNTQQWQFTAQGNLTTLYNKIPYFKKVNQKGKGGPPKAGGKGNNTPAGKGGPDPGKGGGGKDSTKKDNQYEIVDYLARLVMSLRTVNVNYSTNSGMSLPGYKQRSRMMGMDENFAGPTPGFIFGKQDNFGPDGVEFPVYASQQGWLVQTQSLFTPFTRTNTQNLTARANLEPFPDLKVELNATRTYAINKSEFYRWNYSDNSYHRETPTESGNFSMSFISIRTAFKKDDKQHVSEVFEQFLNNRATISQRLGEKNSFSNGYASNGVFRDGYSSTSQDVVIPAFLAAYRGKNAAGSQLGLMPKLPLPNWRVTYDGLSKIEKLKKVFKSVTVGHGYRSTFSIGSFLTNLNYQDQDGDGFSDNVRNSAGDFESKYQLNSISISEQFSPLINVDMTWQNSLSTKVEFKKDRTMNLGLTNLQLTEISGREYVVGLGYRFKKVELPFLKKIFKNNPPKSDLNIRADVSYRNNQTVIRKAVEDYNQLTSGQNILAIKTSADYVLNDKLNVRLFCDRIVTNPLVSSSFKTANTNAGVSLRFTLAQ